MAKNFIKPGDRLTFTAAAEVASGGVVVLGAFTLVLSLVEIARR